MKEENNVLAPQWGANVHLGEVYDDHQKYDLDIEDKKNCGIFRNIKNSPSLKEIYHVADTHFSFEIRFFIDDQTQCFSNIIVSTQTREHPQK